LDYTPRSVFIINQLQTERNWMQEFALKSNTQKKYQWSFGAFGFSRDLRTDVVTTLKIGAISDILQPIFDNIPPPMIIKVADDEIPIPGTFKTPAHGGAVFHQSTYNNLFTDGLSLTAGIRFDYEKTELDYNTSMTMNLNVTPPGRPPAQRSVETMPIGYGSVSFIEWLPKISLKYEFDSKHYMYASAAKGHKAGGYNIQMFADIVRDIIEEKGKMMMNPPDGPLKQELPDSILSLTSYQPEFSWNYELGFKGSLIRDVLHVEAAVFYVDLRDVQITGFVESGQGRLLKNAGRAESVGFDLGLTAYLVENLSLSVNYGYARAAFKNYKAGDTDDAPDYSGNFIPFAPQNTFSLSAGYTRAVHNSRIINRFNMHAQYNGAGKIYWTEANDVFQNFYGLLNLKAGVSKGIFRLNVWTRNSLNVEYATFYFKTGGQSLAQKGAPFQMGVDLTVAF